MEIPINIFLFLDELGIDIGVDTKYFSELVDLGTPALSFIMEKMEKDTKIFSVFRRITKKWFSKVEISDVQYDYYKLYKTWWDGGYKKTPELLEEYYPKWQDAIREGKAEEAETLFRKIRDLGIIIMPALFEKIKMGDYSSLPILEHLTEKKISADEVNKISDKVKKKEYCLDWWNKNKSTYLINFQ